MEKEKGREEISSRLEAQPGSGVEQGPPALEALKEPMSWQNSNSKELLHPLTHGSFLKPSMSARNCYDLGVQASGQVGPLLSCLPMHRRRQEILTVHTRA